MSNEKLTPKQQKFVDHYLELGNATEAARRAGYAGSALTLAVTGAQNLIKHNIQEAIAARQKDTQAKRRASADDVLDFLSTVLFDMGETTQNRLTAAEKLGKRYLLWKDRDSEDLPPPVDPSFDPIKKP